MLAYSARPRKVVSCTPINMRQYLHGFRFTSWPPLVTDKFLVSLQQYSPFQSNFKPYSGGGNLQQDLRTRNGLGADLESDKYQEQVGWNWNVKVLRLFLVMTTLAWGFGLCQVERLLQSVFYFRVNPNPHPQREKWERMKNFGANLRQRHREGPLPAPHVSRFNQGNCISSISFSYCVCLCGLPWWHGVIDFHRNETSPPW